MKRLSVIMVLLLLFVISSCSQKEIASETDDTSVNIDKEDVSVSDKTSEDKKEAEDKDDEESQSEAEEQSEKAEEVDMKEMSVPGYELGEIPAIPIIEVPTVPSYSEEQEKIFNALEEKINSIPGVSLKPATCKNGKIAYVSEFLVTDGNSSVTNTDEGSSVIGKDGSGVLNSDGANVVVKADGSGVLNKDGLTVVVRADGSGTVSDDDKGISLTRTHDGTGSYESESESIVIESEYKGVYKGPNYSLIYSDKDKAQYSSEELSIIISGGKAIITKGDVTATVDAKPLSKVPLIGKIPRLDKLKQKNICGVRIVFDDSILFDFDKFDLRPEGKEVIKKVVDVVDKVNIKSIGVYGHTDSIGSDEYNQKLSENRANAVKNYAMELNVKSKINAKGFGESMPVAPNKNSDGSDNPSGRQANRRVEFFIPVK